jgi:D-glycero-D-manno-heptose 1,7-bisphosphate phosphatase
MKIKTREEIANLLDRFGESQSLELHARGYEVGFTSGSFDILHAGHVDYLEKAKSKCDILIVGVNSDESVKKYKGPHRPIISEQDRIRLVAALDCVDYAFLFDERRNKVNIETLKPDFYIKAGDYKESELTSAKYLEPWGGKVILIPLEVNISTSSIIDKIQHLPSYTKTQIEPGPAIFIDRDGVINEDTGFVHDPRKFTLLPNVIEGLKKFQDMQYKLVIVTNQGGIGIGYYKEEDFFRVNGKMLNMFSANEIGIDKIYFCPHSRSEKCNCRKPRPGMLERGQRELNIDMSRSFMIGDNETDIKAGISAGVKTFLIGESDRRSAADYLVTDLLTAANIIESL